MSICEKLKNLTPAILSDFDSKIYEDEPIFDPEIHLELTEPDFVILLENFKRVEKAPRLEKPRSAGGESQIAYSGPFKVLSAEGYRVLREILAKEMNFRISDDRHPSKIRFGGYRSKWIQDFNRCPKILEHLSRITGDVELVPTTLQSSYSHTNIGYAGSEIVDPFHVDSVPYVLILLACDMSKTVGGKLQLIEQPREKALSLIEKHQARLPEQDVRTINYLGENSCVFMQGSQIYHRVTGIESCSEPRITVVNSFMSADPFASEYSRYDTFRKEKYGALEFALHKMWRANAKLNDLGAARESWPNEEKVVQRLEAAIEELNECRKILTGQKSDRVGFYDEKNKQMTFIQNSPNQLKD